MVGCLFGVVCGMLFVSGAVAQSADEATESAEPGEAPSEQSEVGESQSRPFISTGLNSEALASQRPDQAVWLDSGTGSRVLGLLERESEAPAKGAVLVLADEGQSADAGLAGALRRPLAAAGWAAMTLGLELPPYPLVRARHLPVKPEPEAAMDQSQAPENSEEATPENTGSIMIDVMDKADLNQLRQDYRDRLKAQVGAAVSHLRGLGYQRVALVGIGRGAAPMARLAMEGGAKGQGEPQALVWVVPEMESADLEPVAAARATDLRVLELQSGRASAESASRRQSTIRREGFRGYEQQQVGMGPRPAARDARQVANRISGWLRNVFSPEQ